MSTPQLERYVVCTHPWQWSRKGYCATDDALAFAAASTLRTVASDWLSHIAEHVSYRVLHSGGDLAIARRAKQIPSNFLATIHGVNDQLHEEYRRAGNDIPDIALAAMTTENAKLVVASVGSHIVLHRVRRGVVQRLTPEPMGLGPYRQEPAIAHLGKTPQADVAVYSDTLADDDLFVLTANYGVTPAFFDLLERFGRPGNFAPTLAAAFNERNHQGSPPLLIGRWNAPN